MLWFNFVLGSNFIFLCFKLIIIHYNTQKQKKIKFEPRIKLNHNIHWPFWCRQLVQRQYNFHSKKCRHYERGLHDMLLLHFSNIKVSYLKLTMHQKNLTNLSILLVLRLFVTSKTCIHISMANISSISW